MRAEEILFMSMGFPNLRALSEAREVSIHRGQQESPDVGTDMCSEIMAWHRMFVCFASPSLQLRWSIVSVVHPNCIL